MPNKIFAKYSGAGNTFLISSENLDLDIESKRKFVKSICDSETGFAADGVLFLEKKEDYIEWDFYNSDGSSAEMCGNAARCAYQYCKDYLLKQNDFLRSKKTAPEIRFKTLSGIVRGFEENQKIAIEMPEVKKEIGFIGVDQIANELRAESGEDKDKTSNAQLLKQEVEDTELLSLDTGVPHLVIEIREFEEYRKLEKLCAQLRALSRFPRGTNVTLVKIKTPQSVSAVTFERGVEGFTRACGTGAVAAAIYLATKSAQSEIEVMMPGGTLVIKLDDKLKNEKFNFQSELKKPLLVGGAIYIGKIIIGNERG